MGIVDLAVGVDAHVAHHVLGEAVVVGGLPLHLYLLQERLHVTGLTSGWVVLIGQHVVVEERHRHHVVGTVVGLFLATNDRLVALFPAPAAGGLLGPTGVGEMFAKGGMDLLERAPKADPSESSTRSFSCVADSSERSLYEASTTNRASSLTTGIVQWNLLSEGSSRPSPEKLIHRRNKGA